VENTLEQQVAEVVSTIRTTGDHSIGTLTKMAKDADTLPLLIGYVDDDNADVRFAITSVLIGTHDDRAIPVLLNCLNSDSDKNVRRNAIDALYKYPREMLSRQPYTESLPTFSRYGMRWDENSYKAILILGDIGGIPERECLRGFMKELLTLQGLMGDPSALVPKKDNEVMRDLRKRGLYDRRMILLPRAKTACIKALFKLGDEETEKIILAALTDENVLGRAVASEALAYAERKDLLKNLFPLLKDERDVTAHEYAMYANPGGASYRRVCDVAIDAISDLTEQPFSFRAFRDRPFRYMDEYVQEVKVYSESL